MKLKVSLEELADKRQDDLREAEVELGSVRKAGN